MDYRLLAIDVDGTLMNSRNELSERNRLALHRAHEAGLAVCLCTGRSVTESQPVIDALGLDLDDGVFVFGAIVSDLAAGRTLFCNALSNTLADQLVSHFTRQGFGVLLLYDRSEVGFDYELVAGQRNAETYERWAELSPTRIERVESWTPRSHNPVRVGVIGQPHEIDDTMSAVADEFGPDQVKVNAIYIPNYGLHVVECFAASVNKWTGLMQLAGRLGISSSQIAAIGDDINDLEMILGAGLGVAVGNAIERILSAAKLQVPSNDDAGVAFLVDLLLGGQDDADRAGQIP